MNRKSVLTYLSLKYSTTTWVTLIFVAIFGYIAYVTIPRELAPDITIPYIIVTVPYMGAPPEDIENLITRPLERKLSEIKEIDEMKSTSAEGASMIMLKFKAGINIDDALRKVKEKVDLARGDLPEGIEEPSISEISFSEFPVLYINLVGNYSETILRGFGEDLKEEIEDIPGVLNVDISGGREREIQIFPRVEDLIRYRVALTDIIRAIKANNINIPGGRTKGRKIRFLVRLNSQYRSIDEIKNTPVKVTRRGMVYLRDVADVVDAPAERTSIARIDGKPAVTLTVQKKAGANILEVVARIKEKVREFSKTLPPDVKIIYSSDASKHIKRMLSTLQNNLLTGLLLVLIVLFLFMGWRSAVLVALAIPLSLLFTFLVIDLMGITLNMVVLFSLIIALGMLVDNAIVVIENIYRHYHTRNITLLKAAYDGASEVAMPVLSSTLTTISAFFPLLFWPGVTGNFMSFLPKTVIVALTASYLVAMLFDPLLAATFLRKEEKEEKILREGSKLYNNFEKLVRWALNHRWLTISIAVAFVLVNLILFPILGKGVNFFPETDPDRAFISIEAPDGTTLEETDKIAREVENRLKNIPDIKHIATRVGVSQGAVKWQSKASAANSNKARISIEFVDRHERHQHTLKTILDIRKAIAGIPCAEFLVQREKMGPPRKMPIQVRVTGDDINRLLAIGEEIKEKIRDIPGLYDLKIDLKKAKPEINFRIDRTKLSQMGFNPMMVASTLRTIYSGTKVAKYYEGENEFDITLKFPEKYRTLSYLDSLIIPDMRGVYHPVTEIGTWKIENGFGTIRRINRKREVTVMGNNEGRLASEILKDIKKRLKNISLPPGYTISFQGERKKEAEAKRFLGKAFLYALALIFLILITQFNSIVLPFIIMVSVVLSLGGVFFGLIVSLTPFSVIMTGLGIISLAGVVVNNAIVLIDFIQELREQGYDKFTAAIEASKIRLRPVLLTALTTVIALLPTVFRVNVDFIHLRLDVGDPGAQWWGPMATAIVFGLTFATLLTLVVVPVLYTLLTRDEYRKREEIG